MLAADVPGGVLLAVGSHLGEQLVALGGAFLAAGLLARAGRRIGMPTIPLFIIAGILFGPDTPGLVLVEDPDTLALMASLGLILLLFHLGLEFSLGDLVSGGGKLVAAGTVYLALNLGGGLAFGFWRSSSPAPLSSSASPTRSARSWPGSSSLRPSSANASNGSCCRSATPSPPCSSSGSG
jgi:hypothetical protein